MRIEISIGEGLDRLSILEIKSSEITSVEKLRQVENEIESLNELQSYKSAYSYYYRLMYIINKQIWDLTNVIKQMGTRDSTFAEIAHMIFELNQSRFRVKNIINELMKSNIREQKSYGLTQVNVSIPDDTPKDIIHKHLAYLSISYDAVNIITDITTKSYIEENIPRFNYIFNNTLTERDNITSISIPAYFDALRF